MKIPFQLPYENAIEVLDKGFSIVTLPDGSKKKITIDDVYFSKEDIEIIEREMKKGKLK